MGVLVLLVRKHGESQTFSPRVKSSTTSSCNGLRVCTMPDEEYYEEEEVTSQTSKKGEGFLKAKKHKGELDEQLREYINEWRKQRGKEEEELNRLKEKKAKEAEEKKKRLEEAEMKRQAMMQAQKEK